MVYDDLYAACAMMNGTKIEDGMTVHWDYPGFLNISLDDKNLSRTKDGYGIHMVATPDFVNGETNRVVFYLDCDGHTIHLDDVIVQWEEGKVREQYLAAVAQRLPEIRTLLRFAGEGKDKAVKEMLKMLEGGNFLDPIRRHLQHLYLAQLEDVSLIPEYMHLWEKTVSEFGENAARANWIDFQGTLPADKRADTCPDGR